MKNYLLVSAMKDYLLVSALLISFFSFSQETEVSEESRPWDLSIIYKVGNGKQYSEGIHGLSGSLNTVDLLLAYNIHNPNRNSYFRISSGVSMMDFQSNLFHNNQVASYQTAYLQVPLRFGSYTRVLNQDIVYIVADIGFAGNYHLHSFYHSIHNTVDNTVYSSVKEDSKGWTFAVLATLGLNANITSRSKAGVFFDVHAPFISDDPLKNHRLPLRGHLIGINFTYSL